MGRTRRTERQAPVGYDRFGYAFCCRTVPPRMSPLQPNAQATRGTGGPLREIWKAKSVPGSITRPIRLFMVA